MWQALIVAALMAAGVILYFYDRAMKAENRAEYFKCSRDEWIPVEVDMSEFPGLDISEETLQYVLPTYARIAKQEVAARLTKNPRMMKIYIDPEVAFGQTEEVVSNVRNSLRRAEDKLKSKIEFVQHTANAQIAAITKEGEARIEALKSRRDFAESIGTALQA